MLMTEYKEKREKLLNEAEKLIGTKDFEAKAREITALDELFEKEATEQANLNALKNNKKVANFIAEKGENMMNNINNTDFYDSLEYRKAFKNYVTKGTAIPAEFTNSDANTKTSDVGTIIPTTTLNRIIEKMETIGNILPLVTRTSYKGGLSIPTSSAKPVATWVAEGAGSDKQKLTTGSITFSYHKLRCAVSMSLEVDNMALSAFETKFVNDVANAMIKALEQAIVNGDGSGKPKGILAETPVTGQALTISEGNLPTYETLIAMEAALPAAYESGAYYFMTKKTFMTFLGMTDDAGQPIARVNYGIANEIERILLGRNVVITDEYMDSFSQTVTADTVVAFIFKPSDYLLNTNLNITTKTYEDNDTEDKITKAYMLADGKVVDKNSLVTLTIKNS